MEDPLETTGNPNEGFPSPPSKSDSQSQQTNQNQSDIRLLSHCIFCLRKVIGLNETLVKLEDNDVVPEAIVPAGFLNTFSKFWPLFRQETCQPLENQGGMQNFDETFEEHIITAIKFQGPETMTKACFTRLPPLCQACADKIINLEGLIIAAKQQLRELWSVADERKEGGQYSWRGERFEKELKENESRSQVVEATLQFVRGFGRTSNGPNVSRCEETAATSLLQQTCSTDFEENEESVDVKIEVLDLDLNTSEEVKVEPEDDPNPDSEEDQMEMTDPSEDSEDEYVLSAEEDETDSEMEQESEKEDEDEDEMDDPLWDREDKRKKKSKDNKVVKKKSPSMNQEHSFKCEVPGCDKSYTRSCHLRRHEAKQHPGLERKPLKKSRMKSDSYGCDLCGEKVSKGDLMEHVRGHVGDYAKKCPYIPGCPFVASNPNSLRLHIKNAPHCRQISSKRNREMCVCETCGYKPEYMTTLRAHISQDHERKAGNEFKCPLPGCEQSFGVRQSVWFHLESHSMNIDTKQTCEYCRKRIPLEEIENHLKTIHGSEEVLKCEHCPYVFSSRQKFFDHLFIHRYSGISCDICKNGVKYNRHSELRKHYVQRHNIALQDFVCEHCGLAFKSKLNCTSHIRRKHPDVLPTDEKKRYRCDICDKDHINFASKHILINHKIAVHGVDPYTCKTCGQQFKIYKYYARHMKEHLGIIEPKEFKCPVEGCGKVYTLSQKLRYHRLKVHEGVSGTKHMCELCGNSYTSDSVLKRHRESIHLGIRPHKCNICGKAFVTKLSLKGHMNRLDHRKYVNGQLVTNDNQ